MAAGIDVGVFDKGTVRCDECDAPLTDHMHGCEREPEKVWCCDCFAETLCARGFHDLCCESVYNKVVLQ